MALPIVEFADPLDPLDAQIVPPSATAADELHALIIVVSAHGRTNGPWFAAAVVVVVVDTSTAFDGSASNGGVCGTTDGMTRNRRSFSRIREHNIAAVPRG